MIEYVLLGLFIVIVIFGFVVVLGSSVKFFYEMIVVVIL